MRSTRYKCFVLFVYFSFTFLFGVLVLTFCFSFMPEFFGNSYGTSTCFYSGLLRVSLIVFRLSLFLLKCFWFSFLVFFFSIVELVCLKSFHIIKFLFWLLWNLLLPIYVSNIFYEFTFTDILVRITIMKFNF